MNVKKKATFSLPQKQPFRILFKPIIKFNKLINFSHCRVKILLIKNSQFLLDRTIFFKSNLQKKNLENYYYQLLLIFIFIFVKFFLRAEYTLFRYPFFLHPFSLRRGSIHPFSPPVSHSSWGDSFGKRVATN